jgi:hypothetical protein
MHDLTLWDGLHDPLRNGIVHATERVTPPMNGRLGFETAARIVVPSPFRGSWVMRRQPRVGKDPGRACEPTTRGQGCVRPASYLGPPASPSSARAEAMASATASACSASVSRVT